MIEARGHAVDLADSADQQPQPARPKSGEVACLIAALGEADVRYCHWKGNYAIARVLEGVEDLDLVVDRAHHARFLKVMGLSGCKPAETTTSKQTLGVTHFVGYDHELGRVINVHAYTRLLTGDHLLKASAWPLEELLLASAEERVGIPQASGSAELVIFVLRNLVKDLSPLDYYFRWRSGAGSGDELAWLLESADLECVEALLAQHLPEIPWSTFQRGLSALQTGERGARLRTGREVRRRLRKYDRYGRIQLAWRTVTTTLGMAWGKFGRKLKPMTLANGGVLIGLVGDQASGKSTTIEHLHSWLGQELAVETQHVGKPPATWLTVVPMKLIPLARRLMPGRRTGEVEKRLETESAGPPPLSFVVRRVMMARDRRTLLRRLHRRSRAGRVVICDRYPADNHGAIDSRTFSPEQIAEESGGLRRWLMRLENRYYDEVVPADLILDLRVPVELAVRRNLERVKGGPKQTEEYVRFRHAMRARREFRRSPVVTLDTYRPLDETLAAARAAVWNAL